MRKKLVHNITTWRNTFRSTTHSSIDENHVFLTKGLPFFSIPSLSIYQSSLISMIPNLTFEKKSFYHLSQIKIIIFKYAREFCSSSFVLVGCLRLFYQFYAELTKQYGLHNGSMDREWKACQNQRLQFGFAKRTLKIHW